ncbi:MAG: amidohydrolase family protein [Asgard group archaeon]|nr:amidohydrolase family protein [Asgard group archaeon]
MIIDGHAHAIGEFGDLKRLIPILDSLNVDKVVICPGGGDPSFEPRKPNVKESFITTNPRNHLLSNRFLRLYHNKMKNRDSGNLHVNKMKNSYPNRIIQFFWVNLLNENFEEEVLSSFKKWHFKGLKLHQCVVPFKNNSPEMKRLSEIASEKELPIFIHLYNAREVRRLVALARENPDTNYIVAHMMGLEQIIRYGSDLKNVYFDTSTYYIISKKRIHKAIKYFGVDHIIMGSDSPLGYDNLENIILKIKSLKIPQEERNLILGANITRLLQL